MSNLALKSEGAQVTSATCNDERHPGAAIIDGNEKTFWYTTGLYPQEVVISFGKEINPSTIHVVSRHVRSFTVFKCDKSEPKQWEEVWKSGEVDRNQDSLQNSSKDLRGGSMRFLKLRIENGHEEFSAVYEVRVEGSGGSSSSSSRD